MRAGQDADLARNRTNVGQAASVYPPALIDNRRAHDCAGQFLQGGGNLLVSVGELFIERLGRFFPGRFDGGPALEFGRNRQRLTELLGRGGPHPVGEFGIYRGLGEHALGLSGDPDEFVLHIKDRSDGFLSEEQRLKHVFFRHHARATLNHDNGVPTSGHKQIDIAVLELALEWIDHQIPV